jgi:hypothetical protein
MSGISGTSAPSLKLLAYNQDDGDDADYKLVLGPVEVLISLHRHKPQQPEVMSVTLPEGRVLKGRVADHQDCRRGCRGLHFSAVVWDRPLADLYPALETVLLDRLPKTTEAIAHLRHAARRVADVLSATQVSQEPQEEESGQSGEFQEVGTHQMLRRSDIPFSIHLRRMRRDFQGQVDELAMLYRDAYNADRSWLHVIFASSEALMENEEQNDDKDFRVTDVRQEFQDDDVVTRDVALHATVTLMEDVQVTCNVVVDWCNDNYMEITRRVRYDAISNVETFASCTARDMQRLVCAAGRAAWTLPGSRGSSIGRVVAHVLVEFPTGG